jgi:hypothetical protein
MSFGDDRALVSPPRIGSAGQTRTRDRDRVRARPGDRRACAEGWCVSSVLPITRVFLCVHDQWLTTRHTLGDGERRLLLADLHRLGAALGVIGRMRAALTARTMTSRGWMTELTGHATPLAAADTIPSNSCLNTYSSGKAHVMYAVHPDY